MGEEFWGKGIVTQAVKRAIEFVFQKLHLVRLEIFVLTWNISFIESYRIGDYSFLHSVRRIQLAWVKLDKSSSDKLHSFKKL
ncbi:GNAT family N-acetyltransferase [Acinetobacter nectaris]|uniref:GNAT family N-acetyltransferase n=1 Tax=Acinetobacter nectaris TaxID=1219382 RepID=UPI003899448D